MNNKTHYNLNALIKINTYCKTESDDLQYFPEKKFLGIRIREAGFYWMRRGVYSGQLFRESRCKNLPSKFLQEGTTVYRLPYATFHYQNDYVQRVNFRDDELMEDYVKTILDTINHYVTVNND